MSSLSTHTSVPMKKLKTFLELHSKAAFSLTTEIDGDSLYKVSIPKYSDGLRAFSTFLHV